MPVPGRRDRAGRLLAAGAPWIELVLHACVFASFAVFYVVSFAKIDYALLMRWLPHYQPGLNVNYKRVPSSPRMYAYYTLNLMLTCIPIVGGTAVVTLTRRLPRDSPRRAVRWLRFQARRALELQVPPRRLFSWWCGGMSVLDALLILLYVAANVYWVVWSVVRSRADVLTKHRVGLLTPGSPFHVYLETVALHAGLALHWSLWLLFLPLPHSSFLQALTGIDYAGMIRYHRWLGHGTMVVTSLHGISYYVLWTYQRRFLDEFSDWGASSSINILAGSIAWFGGLLLWATSVAWVRRRHFEVFYGVHLAGFVVYTLFGCIHWQGSWCMFFPGLVLWAIDLVQRQAALANVTAPVGASVNASGGTADVKLASSARAGGCLISHVYLLVPSISRFQWRPFSVRAQDKEATLHLSVKSSGPFTKQLLGRLASKESVEMRVLAPPDVRTPAWELHDSVVVGAGGVGVTGAWNALSSMALERADRRARGQSAAGLPRAVHVVWVARSPDEFFTLERWVAEALDDPDGWLRMTLHCTSPGRARLEASGVRTGRPSDGLAGTLRVSPSIASLADGRCTTVLDGRGLVGAATTPRGRDAPRSEPTSCGDRKPDRGTDLSGGSIGTSSPGSLERRRFEQTFAGNDELFGAARPRLAADAALVALPPPGASPGAPGTLDRSPSPRRLPSAGPGHDADRDASPVRARSPVFARWNASPLFFRALRRVQPSGSGDVVWVLHHLLGYFGAVMCVLCVSAYSIEHLRVLQDPGHEREQMAVYWRQGLLNLVASCVGAFGFPCFWITAPMHVSRYVCDRYGLFKRAGSELVEPYCLPSEPGCIVTASAVRIGGTDVVLPILPGRPDLWRIVEEAEGPVVGVYASGPEPMNHSLRVIAHDLNRLLGEVHYDFHAMSTFL